MIFLQGTSLSIHLHASVQLRPTFLHLHHRLKQPFVQPHDSISKHASGMGGNLIISGLRWLVSTIQPELDTSGSSGVHLSACVHTDA